MPHLEHPYQNLTGGQWLRGNLHTHTTKSDGQREPQAVVDDYAARGYDYLMISDHDIFMSVAELSGLNAKGMVMIPGNEISRNGPHLLHVGGNAFVEPLAERQQVILNSNKDAGGFIIVNHPNWRTDFNHCPMHCLREWVGYAGIEIYNGVISRLDGSPYATDKWDMLLSSGRKCWGYANDDSHASTGDVELGWNTVYTNDRSSRGITEALRTGRFYASTGVVITDILVDGLTVTIKTKNAQRIAAFVSVGRRLAFADSNEFTFTVPDKFNYIRFECWGPGESFAWTQPFFVVK